MVRDLSRFAACALGLAGSLGLSGTACAADDDASGDGTEQSASGHGDPGEIIVYGFRDDGAFAGVSPEDELDELDIAAHGLSTVGELIDDLSANLEDGEEPVILVNGKPVESAGDVHRIPVEALRRVQLLPRTIAPRFGGAPTRKVVNLVMRDNFNQVTANAEALQATRGGARSASGELAFTRIRNGNRINLALRVRDSDALRESERPIATETQGAVPYDRIGNIIPWPSFGTEIDPALSALAGGTVALAGVPDGTTRPTLADFAARAGLANATDLGRFRTLLPQSRFYAADFSSSFNLSKDTTLAITARADTRRQESLTGAASALIRLPAGSPYSPFSRDVGVALYPGDPLSGTRKSDSVQLGTTLDSRIGATWRLTAAATYDWRGSSSRTARGYDLAALQAGVSAGTIDPFAAIPAAALGSLLIDPAHNRSERITARINLAGTIARLPAGALTGFVRTGYIRDEASGRTSLSGIVRQTGFTREAIAATAGFELPVLSGGAIGRLSLDGSASLRHVSRIGTLREVSGGFRWYPASDLTIEGTWSLEREPPSAQSLTDPVVISEGMRVFDFLRNQTVSVTYITGGNPGLPSERRNRFVLNGNWRILPRNELTLSAEYRRDRLRGDEAALPPVSSAVQAAFPDRFVRDAAGYLVIVDARSVSFANVEREQVSWGLSFRKHIKAAPASPGEGGDQAGADRSALRQGIGGLRLAGSLEHTWSLRSQRRARAGLPLIDLLRGGATGYGGGVARHRIDGSLSLSSNGVGLQLNGQWQSASTIRAGSTPLPGDVRFAAYGALDTRVYLDFGQAGFSGNWAKGLRLTVFATNLLDARHRVQDRSGAVPLRYQPFLIDPLGRTAGVGLRKAF